MPRRSSVRRPTAARSGAGSAPSSRQRPVQAEGWRHLPRNRRRPWPRSHRSACRLPLDRWLGRLDPRPAQCPFQRLAERGVFGRVEMDGQPAPGRRAARHDIAHRGDVNVRIAEKRDHIDIAANQREAVEGVAMGHRAAPAQIPEGCVRAFEGFGLERIVFIGLPNNSDNYLA